MSDYDSETEEVPNIGTYTGERDELGRRHGKGRNEFPSGAVYEGDYTAGKREGKGIYKFPDGSIYEGAYVANLRHGTGKLTFADGSSYEGEWVEGMKSGEGVYVYISKDTYKGHWEKDQKHGDGSYTFAESKIVLDGRFENGNFVDGKTIWPNGIVYEGQYMVSGTIYCQPIGKGKFIFPNGCEQKGEYVVVESVQEEEEEEAEEEEAKEKKEFSSQIVEKNPDSIFRRFMENRMFEMFKGPNIDLSLENLAISGIFGFDIWKDLAERYAMKYQFENPTFSSLLMVLTGNVRNAFITLVKNQYFADAISLLNEYQVLIDNEDVELKKYISICLSECKKNPNIQKYKSFIEKYADITMKE
eukprot:TRINITY_DN2933_c5_g4_i1.p1 TRINITY_DN2933_c5_g4~~TRINITY_DN2933_c5_g4_i1.p1  ORF type:complete len:359 (+),score=108.45 TRINITY_DN2933_c5_g4_i1:38-1114(+)